MNLALFPFRTSGLLLSVLFCEVLALGRIRDSLYASAVYQALACQKQFVDALNKNKAFEYISNMLTQVSKTKLQGTIFFRNTRPQNASVTRI